MLATQKPLGLIIETNQYFLFVQDAWGTPVTPMWLSGEIKQLETWLNTNKFPISYFFYAICYPEPPLAHSTYSVYSSRPHSCPSQQGDPAGVHNLNTGVCSSYQKV